MKIRIIIISLLLIPIILFSQGKWTYFTEKDGLLSNKVYGSLADQRGNVWFLTHKGISRFDGTGWFNYNSAELKMKDKFKAFEDSKGNIWFWPDFYANGLAMFDGNDFSYPSKKAGLTCDVIEMITEDSMGRIWIGGRNGWRKGQIDVFDGEKWYYYNRKDGVAEGEITNMLYDSHSNIWVTTWGSSLNGANGAGFISKFDGTTWTSYIESDDLPVNHTKLGLDSWIFEDSKGNVWIGGGYYLNIYQQYSALLKFSDNSWESYMDQIKGIVYRIEEDSEQNIWVFTSTGTYIYTGDKWKPATGMSKINSFLKDDDTIWIGMDVGFGRYNNGKWKYFRPSKGFGGVNVIFKDSKGNIWFGGDNVYLFKNDEWVMKNGKPGLIKLSDVSNIIEDKAGNIWISTKKGVVRYTE